MAQVRIPATEVREIEATVQRAADAVAGGAGIIRVKACGSYRRGKESSGDVDVILVPAYVHCDDADADAGGGKKRGRGGGGGDSDGWSGEVTGDGVAGMGWSGGGKVGGGGGAGGVEEAWDTSEEFRERDTVALRSFEAVLDRMRNSRFITDTLTKPVYDMNYDKFTDSLSWMGVCKLPEQNGQNDQKERAGGRTCGEKGGGKGTSEGKCGGDGKEDTKRGRNRGGDGDGEDATHTKRYHRRLDLKAYAGVQAPFAFVYFTGSSHFNRSLRLFAKQCGLTMGDGGVAACERNELGNRVSTGVSVACRSEREVFDLLGVGYKGPRERNCFDLVPPRDAEENTEEKEAGGEEVEVEGEDEEGP